MDTPVVYVGEHKTLANEKELAAGTNGTVIGPAHGPDAHDMVKVLFRAPTWGCALCHVGQLQQSLEAGVTRMWSEQPTR